MSTELIIRLKSGEVESFDPDALEAEILRLKTQPTYFDRFCAPLGEDCCSKCKQLACPVTN